MNIPGLNFDSKLTVDDLVYEHNSIEEAILIRTQAMTGYLAAGTGNGIVDTLAPNVITGIETDRPLVAYSNSSNALKIDVTPGYAVTKSGAVVNVSEILSGLPLARTRENDVNVIFLENEIQDSDPTRITRYNSAQKVRRSQVPNNVKSVLVSDFNNSNLFPSSRLKNIEVLCYATVVLGDTGLALDMDYTVRNWFSSADLEHRSYRGSGTPTASNPHGIGFNDLVSGFLTLYDQTLKTGVVISRDDNFKGSPGTLCKETIDPTRVITDSGSATVGSRFGGAGASYILLSNYPTTVTAFYNAGHAGRDIAWDWIPGTRIVVLTEGPIAETAAIEYTTTQALKPPSTVYSNRLAFGQPQPNELIIAGGAAINEVASPSFEADGSGPVARNYEVLCNSDGTLIRTPDLIIPPILLDDVGTAIYPINKTLFDTAIVSIGLANANAASSMLIVIRVYGKDSTGISITEDITLSGNSWQNIQLPAVETETQYVLSTNKYSAITDIQVISRTNDGPSSVIILYAEYKTGTSDKLNKLARVCSFLWDGLALRNLVDKRNIVSNINEKANRYLSAAFSLNVGLGALIATEDLALPQWLTSRANGSRDDTEATNATFNITVDDYTQFSGVQITLPTGAILVPVLTSPDRAVGEFLVVGSNMQTRNDIVSTINNSSFNSGVIAAADATNPNLVNCTVVQKGARGNGETVVSPAIQNFVSVSNAVGGIDEAYFTEYNRHDDFIDSEVPNSSNYYPFENGYYLSKPIPIGGKTKSGVGRSIQALSLKILGTLPPHDNIQVRMRVASGSDDQWKPWEVMAGDAVGFFTYTDVSTITRCQIRVFGRFDGFALYEVL